MITVIMRVASVRRGENGKYQNIKKGASVTVDDDEAVRMIAKGQAVAVPSLATPLPTGFPAYSHLTKAGHLTVEAVAELAQADLVAINGIGAKTARDILEALEV